MCKELSVDLVFGGGGGFLTGSHIKVWPRFGKQAIAFFVVVRLVIIMMMIKENIRTQLDYVDKLKIWPLNFK